MFTLLLHELYLLYSSLKASKHRSFYTPNAVFASARYNSTIDLSSRSFTIEFWYRRLKSESSEILIIEDEMTDNKRLSLSFTSDHKFVLTFRGSDLISDHQFENDIGTWSFSNPPPSILLFISWFFFFFISHNLKIIMKKKISSHFKWIVFYQAPLCMHIWFSF